MIDFNFLAGLCSVLAFANDIIYLIYRKARERRKMRDSKGTGIPVDP